MAGLDPIENDTDAWATGANQALNALNDGFIPDQTLNNATGVLTTNATFASGTTFTVAGDATAFYTVGRRLKIVHGGGTTYCEVASSAFAAGVTTVTIGSITQGPATMTTPITSAAAAPIFTGNAGNQKAASIDFMDEGASVSVRGKANFIGPHVALVDNGGAARVDVTIDATLDIAKWSLLSP